jgi:hypothetical protein
MWEVQRVDNKPPCRQYTRRYSSDRSYVSTHLSTSASSIRPHGLLRLLRFGLSIFFWVVHDCLFPEVHRFHNLSGNYIFIHELYVVFLIHKRQMHLQKLLLDRRNEHKQQEKKAKTPATYNFNTQYNGVEWIGEDVEESSRGLIVRYYPDIRLQRLRKVTINLRQDSQCPASDPNRASPGYKSKPLSLEPMYSVAYLPVGKS